MSQKPITSIIESICNVGSGFIIALLTWRFIIGPLYDIEPSMSRTLSVTSIFTSISIVRGFIWRRLFNREEASNQPMYSQNHVNELNATIASLRYKVDTTKGMWAFDRDLKDVDFKWIRRNALN